MEAPQPITQATCAVEEATSGTKHLQPTPVNAAKSRPRRDGAMKGVVRFEACPALPSKLAHARVAAGLSLETVPARMAFEPSARFERYLVGSPKRKRAKEHSEKP